MVEHKFGWAYFNTILPALLLHPAIVSRLMAMMCYYYALLAGLSVGGYTGDIEIRELLKPYTKFVYIPTGVLVNDSKINFIHEHEKHKT